MSSYVQKLQSGIVPSAQDWVEYLQTAHQNDPGQTPLMFAHYRDQAGFSSYQSLAHTLQHTSPLNDVLDLACGNGALIPWIRTYVDPAVRIHAVDMSDAELKDAQRENNDPHVTFYQAMAQSLPLPDHSVDAALCHMAFMLMLPLEPVVRELARVLRPGAPFSAVMGGRLKPVPIMQQIRQIQSTMLHERFPELKQAPTGDPRVYHRDGLLELFNPRTGFSDAIGITPIDLLLDAEPEALWKLHQSMYLMDLLDETTREVLHQRIVSAVEAYLEKTQDDSTVIPLSMTLIEVRRL